MGQIENQTISGESYKTKSVIRFCKKQLFRDLLSNFIGQIVKKTLHSEKIYFKKLIAVNKRKSKLIEA